MLDLSLSPGDTLFYLFLIYIFAFLIQQCFYWILFIRIAFKRGHVPRTASVGISVVICARNEYENLKNNLPLILEQDYPEFEVVVVNWASDDDSAFLLSNMADQYPNLKIVEIRENLNFFSGKKFPLSIGIKSAKNEIIIVTDAGCRPVSRNWLSLMGVEFKGSTEIVLGYGAYEKHKGFLNKLIRFDTVHIGIRYLSSALAGIPFMGVGRNMAYLKSLFIRNKGFISHYRIHSGDDDLFINKVAKKSNTHVMLNPDSFMISEQRQNFRQWMIQKKNQSWTTRFYRSRHRILFAVYSLSIFLFYLLFVVLLVMNYNPVLILPVFCVRLITQIFLFHRCMVKLNEKDLIWLVPFYEVAMLVIDTFTSVSNLVTKPNRWK
jgi:glycosyltransferase involved in cell wall biosynthesis